MGDNQINSDGALAVFLCVKANVENKLREIDFSVRISYISENFISQLLGLFSIQLSLRRH